MNTKETGKVVNLSDGTFQNEVLESAFIQKVISKKGLIIRKASLFLFGFVFYLVFSSL